MIGPLAVLAAAVWGAVAAVAVIRARQRAEAHHYNAMMWRASAIGTAKEWVRRSKGDAAADDFGCWANSRSDVILRDHLPEIARKHSAVWPNVPGGAA